jgi:isocitrate dehydrogenase
LGEFLAIAVSIEDLGLKHKNNKAKILAETLDAATGRLLENDRSPSRKVGEIDNRGSHFYLSLYWADELANQSDDADLAAHFKPIYAKLSENENAIMKQLNDVQGKSVDIGGYYLADPEVCAKIMRPSEIFNNILKA